MSSNALAVSPAQKTLKDLLTRAAPSLQRVIPKHLSTDRLISIALSATSKEPKLLECTPQSVLRAVMQSTQLGLEPGGALQEAYLVPYGKQCTFIAGYQGLIKLALQSGKVGSIEARVVHEKDRFQLRFGIDPILAHEPSWEEDPGVVIGGYAIAHLVSGGKPLVEFMTKAQLDKVKKASKVQNGPWSQYEEEMQRKTLIRRISKFLPKSAELARALQHDEDVEAGTFDHDDIALSPENVEPAGDASQNGGKTDALKAKLKGEEAAPCEACGAKTGHLPGCPNA